MRTLVTLGATTLTSLYHCPKVTNYYHDVVISFLASVIEVELLHVGAPLGSDVSEPCARVDLLRQLDVASALHPSTGQEHMALPASI